MNADITPWQLPPPILMINSGELHLWRINLHCTRQSVAKNKLLLSNDELIRAERLLDAQKSSQFVVSRAGLRIILGQYLDTDPKQISLQINQAGKPSLADLHCSPLTFNLSHSGQWAVLAITNGIQVGVD
ncbi:MAG: hypothetical protein KAG93_07380, partial [Desulfuromusa sp.]|nr:hypothetical protein [Desulfuromusa sp.]